MGFREGLGAALGLWAILWGFWALNQTEGHPIEIVDGSVGKLAKGKWGRHSQVISLAAGQWIRFRIKQGHQVLGEMECEGPGDISGSKGHKSVPLLDLGSASCQLLSLTPGAHFWVKTQDSLRPQSILTWRQSAPAPKLVKNQPSILDRMQARILACLEPELRQAEVPANSQLHLRIQAHKPLMTKSIFWQVHSEPHLSGDALRCLVQTLESQVRPQDLPGYVWNQDLVWQWPLTIEW